MQKLVIATLFLVAVIHLPLGAGTRNSDQKIQQLTVETASRFAKMALRCLHKEFPNKLDHVINEPEDVKRPKELHPAFYGCFDWHSCVHGHWMLVHLLRTFPDLPDAEKIRRAIDENLTAENIATEVAYLHQPNRKSFERTYGWTWLLKLADELHDWDDPDGKRWSRNLQPLVDAIVQRYLDFLPKQTYPIRRGVHQNTAFGLIFALDYSRAVGNSDLEELIVQKSRDYYLNDRACPASWEPSGDDFLSPCLIEADLMRRVLPKEEFSRWFHQFLPGLEKGEPRSLLEPAVVSDRTDPKIVHLDGLNLSRAWCMKGIAASLSKDDPVRQVLLQSAQVHGRTALAHVASGDYAGEHWLASFAVYMLSVP